MSKKIIKTDPVARLKMLAAMALAEAEDGRSDPNEVIPFLGSISTEHLRDIFSATKYGMIELYIIKELATRKDLPLEEFLGLVPLTTRTFVKEAICTAVASKRLETKSISMETIDSLCSSPNITEPIKESLRIGLQDVPAGELPKLLRKYSSKIESLVIEEIKRRDDPLKEGLLRTLTMGISPDATRAVIALLEQDRRITPEYMLSNIRSLPETSEVDTLFFKKIRRKTIEQKKIYYKTGRESFRTLIIASFYDDPGKALPIIDFLIRYSQTEATYVAIIRTLGPQLPIEKLLELRSATNNDKVSDAFAKVFGEHTRYLELQKFLSS